MVIDRRVNSFHSPRKIYFQKNIFSPNNEIKNKEIPTYLFLIGPKQASLDIGQLIYKNNSANQFCYRIPNKPCKKTIISLNRVNDNKNFIRDLF